jgi:argininosuccinate lyase
MAAAAIADFTLATDAADLLAKHGVPFREAHGVVGRLVAACIAGDKTFADLSDAEWAAIHPVFADEKPPLTALESVSIRDIPGGTAPNRVRDAIVTARLELDDHRSWFGREAAAYAALFTRP